MALKFNAGWQAAYMHQPLGHSVPSLASVWTAAGLYRRDAVVASGLRNTLIVALYSTTDARSWVGLYMNDDGTSCRLEGWNGTPSAIVTSGSNFTMVEGREYHLAIDYNGAGTVRCLVDGVQVLSMAFTPTTTHEADRPGERSLQWGGYGELENYTDCTIARWRMWSALLTEAEHRREYRSTVPVRTRNLLHNWPMEAGSGRFDDTVAGEPDLVDNPLVPCGDGTAFIYRPSILGAPQLVDLGSTATPGVRTVNVPEWAQYAAVHIVGSDDTVAPYTDLASIASDFSAAFSNTGNAAIATSAGGWVCTAPVANWAAGRSVTIAFTQANSLSGAHAFVYFVQDTTGVTARGYGQATGDGTTAGVASATGVADGLAVALDTRLNAASGAFPGNEAGWESVLQGESTGSIGYWTCSLLRSKRITANGTETATTQNTYAGPITLATWAPASLATVAPAVAFPVAGDVTASGNNTASTPWGVACPAMVAGDMLLVHIGWDDSTDVTAVTPPAGPNGEAATLVLGPVASNGTEARLAVWRYIATGTWAAANRNFTPSASEQWTADVLKVLAGEFDATTPIGATATRSSAGTAETSMLSPAYNAGATDGGGRLVMFGVVDDDPVLASATAWSTLSSIDRGAISGTLAARNLEVSNSEALAAGDWRIQSDSWATGGYIIRKPATPGVTLAAAAAAQASGTAALALAKSLAASGAAQATAGASLLKAVQLTAAGIANAGGSASISHGVPLQASAAAVAVAGAQLALSVQLSASGLAAALASAGVSVGKPLSAAGAAQAAGSAELQVSSGAELSAAGTAQASATAVLSLSVRLGAVAIAQALASAALATGKPLSAAGSSQATGAAGLQVTAGNELSAHGAAQASATAALQLQKRLAAAAFAQALASAGLQVGNAVDLLASGAAQASASASLHLTVPLTAQALAQAISGGSLQLTVPLSANAFAQASATAQFQPTVQLSAHGAAIASASALLQVVGEYARAPAGGSGRYDVVRPVRAQEGGRPSRTMTTRRPSR